MKHSISVLSRSVEVSINTASNFVKGFGTTSASKLAVKIVSTTLKPSDTPFGSTTSWLKKFTPTIAIKSETMKLKAEANFNVSILKSLSSFLASENGLLPSTGSLKFFNFSSSFFLSGFRVIVMYSSVVLSTRTTKMKKLVRIEKVVFGSKLLRSSTKLHTLSKYGNLLGRITTKLDMEPREVGV